MKERPILFSTEMVRAILEGRKIQTRRVIKVQPSNKNMVFSTVLGTTGDKRKVGKHQWVLMEDNYSIDCEDDQYFSCPYGFVGDQLWVRETFRIVGWQEGNPYLIEYKDGTQLEEPGDSSNYDEEKYIQYLIDCSDDCEKAGVNLDTENNQYLTNEFGLIPTRWRPSIFMPRWASRIKLEVIGVRVERVQDISEEDAIAEGVEKDENGWKCYSDCECHENGYRNRTSATASFMSLWDLINAKRGFGWDKNPFVWVVEFKVIKP